VQKINAATPPPDTTPQLIALAVSRVGDQGKVMEQMRCSEADFLLYRSCQKEVPFEELHRLVSVIIHEQQIKIRKQGERLNAIHAKRMGDVP
jgi:hypothetical protein